MVPTNFLTIPNTVITPGSLMYDTGNDLSLEITKITTRGEVPDVELPMCISDQAARLAAVLR